MTDTAVIVRTVLDQLLDSIGGDTEFLSELLDTYFQDSPVLISAMRTSLAAGDAEGLRRAAHSLKSNSANFGAMRLSAHSKELEAMGRAGTLVGAAEVIDLIMAEYEEAQATLESIRRSIR